MMDNLDDQPNAGQPNAQRFTALEAVGRVSASVELAWEYLDQNVEDETLTEDEVNALNNYAEMLLKIAQGLAEVSRHKV